MKDLTATEIKYVKYLKRMDAFFNIRIQYTDNHKKFYDETDPVQQKIMSLADVHSEAIKSGTSGTEKSFIAKLKKLIDEATKFAVYHTELYQDGLILMGIQKEFFIKLKPIQENIGKKDLKYVLKQLEQLEKEYCERIRAGWRAQSKKITRGWDIHKKLCGMYKPFEN